MIRPEQNRKNYDMNLRRGPGLNSSFNWATDQYYNRADRTNTNEQFSIDHDNNYEPNTDFTSNTNPNSGSNYNQQLFEDGPHYGKGPKGYRRSDKRIKEDVCEALYAHHEIDASEMEVSVNEGTVKLSGTVESRELKRMIEDAVDQLSGVEDVQNKLKISKKGIDDSNSLKSQKGLENAQIQQYLS